MSIEVTCIKKAGGWHEDPHEAISVLGWKDETSSMSGRMSREDMYDWIKNKGGKAFVRAGRLVRAEVIAVQNSRGTRYVKTKPDATTKDNLLKLPECA